MPSGSQNSKQLKTKKESSFLELQLDEEKRLIVENFEALNREFGKFKTYAH
jgi:hypothetical protein